MYLHKFPSVETLSKPVTNVVLHKTLFYIFLFYHHTLEGAVELQYSIYYHPINNKGQTLHSDPGS